MAAEIDFWGGNDDRVFLAVDALTAIERSLGDFTFSVRDVEVDAKVAWRRGARRGLWTVAGGRRLTEFVDADGSLGFWYLSGAWETVRWTDPVPPSGFGARVEAGGVIDPHGLSADILAKGAARWAWRVGRVAVGLEASVDALIGGDAAGSDLQVGPRLDIPAGPAQGVTIYARWLRGENPMGLRLDGVLAGFEIVERPTAIAASPGAAELGGLVGAGVTDRGRGSSRLLLRASSPRFLGALRVAAEVDANALDSEESGDLWYRYMVLASHPLGPGRMEAGFYHRSNHVLSGPNPVGVTSVNVLEVGHDSTNWDRVPDESDSRWGRLDWRARGGWIVASSFGEDRRWSLRGGARWALRRPSWGWAPFATVEVEEGDASSRRIAAGCVRIEGGWEIRAEWARDDQWFRADRSALVLGVVARYGPGGGGTSDDR